MTMPWISTVTANAAVANSVATSQTPGAAGNLTLTASTVTFASSAAQKVTITTNADESGKTFTIYGTSVYDGVISETMTGPSTTTGTSTLYYKSVTRIAVSAATTAAVTAGNAAAAEGAMYVPDMYSNPFSVGMGCQLVSAAATYSIQHTFYNTQATGFTYSSAVWFTHSVISAKTANQDGNYDFPVYGIKLILSAAGTVTVRLLQSGMGSR